MQYKGQIPYPQADGTTKMVDNGEFTMRLTFVGTEIPNYDKKRIKYRFVDATGARFLMFKTQFDAVLRAVGPIKDGDAVFGRWTFMKSGPGFGLELVSIASLQPQAQTQTQTQAVATAQAIVKSKIAQAVMPPPTPVVQPKCNFFAVCLDRSGSMSSIRKENVVEAFNQVLTSIKENAATSGQETFVSIWEFGGIVGQTVKNIKASELRLIKPSDYTANGGNTPLFECVHRATTDLELTATNAQFKNTDNSFFVYVISDGEENASNGIYAPLKVNEVIKNRQATDRWTYAFQLPKYSVDTFIRSFAVPAGNVQGWETNDAGIIQASKSTAAGISNYYNARKSGLRSVSNVYTTNLSKISDADLAKLNDMSRMVKFYKVDKEEEVKAFAERVTRRPYEIGSVWYQLTKREDVQPQKGLMIRVKHTKQVYGGADARKLLGLPSTGTIRLVPGDHSRFDIFITSTSVNRKLVRGTEVLFMPPSAPMAETWDSAAAKAAADAKKAQHP